MYSAHEKPPTTGFPGLPPSIGSPVAGSTFAAMSRQIGSKLAQALRVPEGISDGPKRAPVSPPDTPEPIKSMPLTASSFSRRMVSVHSELPPSIIMSPCSKKGSNALMVTSVALPAFTNSTILRGRLMLRTKEAKSACPTTLACEGSLALHSLMKFVIFLGSRLYTAMV